MSTVSVRYFTDDIDGAIAFYVERFGFEVEMRAGDKFARLARGGLRLLLNRPGAGGAGQPTPDGRQPASGGWNRIQIEVADLEREVATLRAACVAFRGEIVTGRGGSQIVLDDPSGNPIELFQPIARASAPSTMAPSASTRMPQSSVLLRGEETGGQLSVTEIVVPPHSPGPPLHTHDFDERFHMLDGELIFRVEDDLTAKRAGESSFAPRNIAHTLANHSDAPASYLLVCSPAGFERHWARVAAEAAGAEPPEWALQPIPEIIVVGPPIARPD